MATTLRGSSLESVSLLLQGGAGLGTAFKVPTLPHQEGLHAGPGAGGSRYPMLMADANPAVDQGMIHRADSRIDLAMVHSPDPERKGLVKANRAPAHSR